VQVIDPEIYATERVRPLRRAEYERLAALGFFEDERVELLEGIIVEMSPPGAPHSDAVRKLNKLFVIAVGDRAVVQIQDPVGVSDDSEPQPDVAVIPNDDYADEHPGGAAQRGHRRDEPARNGALARHRQAHDAARAGRGHARDGSSPEPVRGERGLGAPARSCGGGERVTVHHPGETIRPQAFPDIEVPVADIVPKAR
jgi:hypothetical protein